MTSTKRSNLVGKFTTSVKKFVQDVEFDHTREGAVQTSERVHFAQQKISESYQTVRSALIKLHERYEASKAERNIVRRYALFKAMVKDVICLDTQYWVLLDLPKQEKQEQVTSYVLRACATLEKASDSRAQDASKANSRAEEEARERKQRLDSMSVQEIEEENSQSINDLYRLLKKYGNLRGIVHGLQISYTDAKVYPFIPRYNMLKDMIKCVLRDPSYMEVCHEDSSRT
ncbi:uncharacterized protein LOC135367928 isoform X2 [Ornithodoros turicata]|uniref:uncharacterized protein LOC135367928 isoform X2 n=1 Tax=Ornithodoros turicata TaxID=34597 RepID=UPI003138798E